MPAFIACTSSPEPGRPATAAVGHHGDFHFVLASAHRFDEHDVFAEGIERIDDAGRRGREATEAAACCHATQEDIAIRGEVLHADAVAEQRALAERRGRIDRDDAKRAPAAAQLAR